MRASLVLVCFTLASLYGQEAGSGLDVRATLSGVATASDLSIDSHAARSTLDGGFRALIYPTWKMSEHWIATAVVEGYLEPDVARNFSDEPRTAHLKVLQANLGYSQFWRDGSITFRAGELTTAFGSFPSRYDDAENPLIGMPRQYGYYDTPVYIAALTGAQIDIAHRKWDARVQLVSSSPANPLGLLAKDQYANWAGGIGYTIHQGLRAGFSTYQGPYLSRGADDFPSGEARPRDIPAHAYGLDIQWARGHWNTQFESQSFQFSHRAIPSVRNGATYLEVQRVLHPRWYAAARGSYGGSNINGGSETIEGVIGFRPAAHQLIKLGYEYGHGAIAAYRSYRTLSVQFVATIHALSLGRN